MGPTRRSTSTVRVAVWSSRKRHRAAGNGIPGAAAARRSLEPFYREQSFDNAPRACLPSAAPPASRCGFNTTTPTGSNPGYGSRTSVAASRDWGAVSDMPSWSQYEFEFAKYFALGETAAARQRVLAFVVWTSDVPTWNSPTTIDGQPAFHRPPTYAGSTLGGLERQAASRPSASATRLRSTIAEYRHVRSTIRSIGSGCSNRCRSGGSSTWGSSRSAVWPRPGGRIRCTRT